MSTWWVAEDDLDEDQLRVITLEVDGRYLVSGPPGSGKTNLLLLRASYLEKKQHSDYQILGFTRSLGWFLRSAPPKYEIPPDRVDTAMGWMMKKLKELGGTLNGLPTDFTDKRNELAERILNRLQDLKQSTLHKTILLDEAQDFTPKEMELFFHAANNLFIVGDKRQLIYGGEATLGTAEKLVQNENIYKLRYHYRNSPDICKMADRFAKEEDGHAPMHPTCNYKSDFDGRVSQHSMNKQEQFRTVLNRLETQLLAYPKEPLGVISPTLAIHKEFWSYLHHNADLLAKANNLGDSDQIWSPNRRITVAPIYQAKGLEFRAVHLPCLDKYKGMPHPRAKAYTAITRAKSALDIYYENPLPGWIQDALRDPTDIQDEPTIASLFGDS
ncbi:MAG: UvrD-helicase domain-containing protein [Myxococcota bacterium]